MLLFAATLIVGGLSARKVILKSGSASKLKSIKKWSVILDYEGMVFDKKGNEKDWLEKTQKEKNDKEAGTGDAFVDDWNDSKDDLFPSSFATGITKVLSKKYGVSAKEGRGGATITVKTTWAFAGYRVPPGIFKDAKITSTITIKDADGNELAVFEIIKAERVPDGLSSYNGFGYKVSERMSASYLQTGYALGKDLKKATYK